MLLYNGIIVMLMNLIVLLMENMLCLIEVAPAINVASCSLDLTIGLGKGCHISNSQRK